MPYDKRVDDYIAKAQPFARPIMERLRQLIHQVVPDVQETIKWNVPAFEYQGPMCGMAAFKKHMHFLFWKGMILDDPSGHLGKTESAGKIPVGSFSNITSMDQLPPDNVIIHLLRQAARLNDEGIELPKPAKKAPAEITIPDDLKKALKANKQALAHFDAFSYSKRKDYVDWITSAKTEKTRDSRIATALEWIAEGKGRNWKYER